MAKSDVLASSGTVHYIKSAIMKNFFFFLLFSSFFSCSKDRLTPATQKGANTFSCKIDGKLFKPSESGGWFGSPPIAVYNSRSVGFTLFASFYETDNGQIPKDLEINLNYLQTKGTYDLGLNPYAMYMLSYSGGAQYYTSEIYTGQVNITRCDTVNKIYSGTFFFKAIDASTGKIVNVTDGRFDVKGK